MHVLTLGPADHDRVVLFAAGASGDPERHRPLLEHLAAHGCQVIAPVFDRLDPQAPATADLVARPAGLRDALREHAVPDASVAVVGFSVGGWAALCLAGAVPYGRDGVPLDVPREPRVARLVLHAPAAGWFAAPGALDAVTAPTLVFAGDQDTVTPVELVRTVAAAPGFAGLHVVPGADHFGFMAVRPPGTTDPEEFDRPTAQRRLAEQTLAFVLAG